MSPALCARPTPVVQAVGCASGCTEACPGGAALHASVLREPVREQTERDWEQWQVEVGVWRHRESAPMPRVDEPHGLPEGWVIIRTYDAILSSDDDVYLVRCPPEPGRVSGWLLLSQWISPRGVANVPSRQLWDTTLARLATELDFCLPDHTHKDDPWLAVRDRVRDTVAEFYDLTDPDEAAEATLYALSGQVRRFPREALT